MDSMWTLYRCRWNFITKLCASVPADPELVKKWLESRAPKVKPADAKTIDEIQEEVLASLGEVEEEKLSLLHFQKHDGCLVERYSTIKAHIKDCARVLSAQYISRIEGERAFSTRVTNGLYVDEQTYWVPILRPDGKPIKAYDGETDKAIHVTGRRGQKMDALKRYAWVQPARMDFILKVLGNSVHETDLSKLFTYGGTHGYGGERGDGEGRYRFEVQKITNKEVSNGKKQKSKRVAATTVEDD